MEIENISYALEAVDDHPKIKTNFFLDEKGILVKEFPYSISEEDLIRGYKTMEMTRLIEEKMFILQRQGSVTFTLNCRGEEAAIVGSAAALSQEDWLYPQYRESGILLWRGYSIENYVHGMLCNGKDIHLGRQMPVHFGCRELNIVTVSSVLATQLPHAAGCAYAMKMQKENNVALAYIGEGAAAEGDFHNALDFAAVRKAPVIFFCRNNGYAISTPAKLQRVSDGVAPQAIGHGVKTWRVDGNDYFAVYAAVTEARRHCLSGKGPAFIEAMSYRLGPHSSSDDPSRYRDDAEAAAWEKRCPIKRLRSYLEKQGLWDEEKDAAFKAEVTSEIEKAVEIGLKTPPPPLDTLISDVYFETPQSLKDQLDEVKQTLQREQ